MATLAFNVEADYEKVIRLRDEIARLEVELNKVAQNGTPEEIGRLESQLESCRAEMKEAVKTASELGASIEESVKTANFTSVQAQVDALTYAISQSEAEMARTAIELNNLREQGQKAFEAGDTAGLDAINQQIGAQVNQYRELQEATERYKQALQGLTDGGVDTSLEGLSAVMLQIGNACQREESEIAKLEKEYQSLNTRLVMNVQQGTEEHKNILERMQAVQGEISVRKELVAELKAQDEELELAVQKMREQNKVAQETSEQHASLRTQIRLLKEQMADMRANGIDEQSDAYRRLAQELGRLQDIQGDIQRQGSILANDERSFAGITSGLQGMSSGFLAVQGAMMLFGEENQKLQSVLMKTHAIMSMVNALQQVSAMLNKDSAFRLVTLANAREWWNKVLDAGRGKEIADTAATQANTVAKQANTAAQTGNATATGVNTAAQTAQTGAAAAGTAANITLAGAFRMVGAAIKSIPVFGWIAAGISAIVAVTAVFIKRANEAKKAAQEFHKALADEVYKPVGAVRQLSVEWAKLGDSMEEKQKYIEQNREKLDKLGVVIRDVSDVERLLVDNADAFIQAQIAKARATVYLQQAMEAEKAIAEKETEREKLQEGNVHQTSRTRWNWRSFRMETEWGDFGGVNDKQIAKLDEEIGKEEKKINDLYGKAIDANKEAVDIMAQNGLKTTEEAVAGSANKIKEKIQSLQRDLENNYKVGSEGYNRVKKEIDALQEQLNGGNGRSGGTARVTDNSEREARERERAQEQLNKDMLSLERQNQQAEIDLMDEGTQKKLAQIEHSYKLQIAKIEELAKEMAEANAKAGVAGTNSNGLTDEQQAQVNRQLDLLTQTYDKERKEVTDAQIKAEEQAWNEYLIKYGDYLEQRQALINKYETAISEAQTKGEAEMLQKELESALYSLDNSAERTTSIISRLFEDMSRKTVSELRDIIDTAELVMQYLGAERDEQGNANINGITVSEQDILDLGLTPETLKRLRESPDDMKALRKAIENVRKELGNKSPFQKMAQDIKNATQQLKDGKLGEGIQNIAEALDDYLQSVAELGVELANAFGSDKISNSISKVSEAMSGLTAVGGGIGQAMSGDIVGGIQGALGGVATMVSSIGSLFSRESDKTLERDIEALTVSNQSLEYAISELTDKISDNTTSLAEAQEAYEQSLENIAQMEANTMEMMARSGAAYSSGIGGSHSSNYRIDTSLSSADWQRVSEAAGKSVTSASDFWTLTSEQMYNVALQASDLYALIKDKADDGYKDASQYMDDYIEYWKEAEDVSNAFFEKLTNTSFDSLTSGFKSAVSDMTKTASDFADDFEDLMKNAVIDSMMTSKYNKDLEKWYEDFAKAMESDETLTPQEQQDLKDSYMQIVNDARDELEGLYDTLGWSRASYSQQGTSGGWETMSEDTGQELNGRFTALQATGVELLTESKEQTEWAREIYAISAQVQSTLVDSYLELQEINDNTASTVTRLTAIEKYMKSVKENTDKL